MKKTTQISAKPCANLSPLLNLDCFLAKEIPLILWLRHLAISLHKHTYDRYINGRFLAGENQLLGSITLAQPINNANHKEMGSVFSSCSHQRLFQVIHLAFYHKPCRHFSRIICSAFIFSHQLRSYTHDKSRYLILTLLTINEVVLPQCE